MSTGNRLALVLGAAIVMAAGAGAAQAVTTSEYLMKAGASDKFEIETAKLEMTSADPKLKHFASMMVTDHTKSTAMVKAAAMKAGLHPKPPMLDAKQHSDLAALKMAHGSARDTLYVTQQKAAHDDALALQKGYSMSGSSAPLKMTAAKIVPVVEKHIGMLSGM